MTHQSESAGEAARRDGGDIEARVAREPTGVTPFDLHLEQLRTLLVGREIETDAAHRGGGRSRALRRGDQPRLPAAIAQATRDERLGQVLAPAGGELGPARSHHTGRHPASADRAGDRQIDRRH